MDKELIHTNSYSNSEKRRMCRLFALAPACCLVFVLLTLLVCLKIVPGKAGDSDTEECLTVNCTIVTQNRTSRWSCLSFNMTEDTPGIESRLQRVIRYATDEAQEIRSALTTDKHSEKGHSICSFHKPVFITKIRFQKFSEDITSSGKWVIGTKCKKAARLMCLIKGKTKAKICTCSSPTNMDVDTKSNMERNTKVFCLALAVILSLSLLGFLLMCVFVSRVLKICCKMCYHEEDDVI